MTKQYTKETDRIIAGILENDGKTSIEFGRIYFADFDQCALANGSCVFKSLGNKQNPFPLSIYHQERDFDPLKLFDSKINLD